MEWPNEEPREYGSATEFILKTAKAQMSYTAFDEMKIQLSKRALTMTGKFIHPFQPDEPFIRELGRVGFLKVSFRRAE